MFPAQPAGSIHALRCQHEYVPGIFGFPLALAFGISSACYSQEANGSGGAFRDLPQGWPGNLSGYGLAPRSDRITPQEFPKSIGDVDWSKWSITNCPNCYPGGSQPDGPWPEFPVKECIKLPSGAKICP